MEQKKKVVTLTYSSVTCDFFSMHSHLRTASAASFGSTLTEISDSSNDAANSSSSAASDVSASSVQFKRKVQELIDNECLSINSLEKRARQFINDLEQSKQYNRPIYGPPSIKRDVDLAKILGAMLTHAHGCGGVRGLRYTASAICACHGVVVEDSVESSGNTDDEVNSRKLAYLQSLATTWLSHLLFVCKC
jgi:hypothetical protein